MYMAVQPRLFILGLGFVGQHVSSVARGIGWQVAGSCRTAKKAEAMQQAGIEAYLFNINESPLGLTAQGLAALRASTHVLVTVPPVAGFDGDPMLMLHGRSLLNSVDVRTAIRTSVSMCAILTFHAAK